MGRKASDPGKNVRQAFEIQADACGKLGSPFTSLLCRIIGERLDGRTAVGRKIQSWPGDLTPHGDSVPLRLAGALRGVVMAEPDCVLARFYPPNAPSDNNEAMWAAIENAFAEHADFILDRLRYAPQTNEIGRSAVLYCGLSLLAERFGLPLVLSELGASAGLNMIADQYGYVFDGAQVGNAGSEIRLEPEWIGNPPPLSRPIIVDRSGCDINPLDVHSRDQMARMLSFIWADQAHRIERTEKAIELACQFLPRGSVVRADAADWLGDRLAVGKPGSVQVVLHTIAWQYFPGNVQRKCERSIRRAGESATDSGPLAWLSLEGDGRRRGAPITMRVWPGGEVLALGRADYHGNWIDWKGRASNLNAAG